MNYMKIEKLASKLPPQERIRLAESLLHSLRVEKAKDISRKTLKSKITISEQSSLRNMLGVLRVEGYSPTDDHVENLAASYLLEKYS